MHLESVKLLVDEFARLVLPLGTTAVVADPHEIANVLGVDGVHWLLDASSGLQLDVFFMAPSCVPASPFESPRRPLAEGDLESLMRRRRVLGLAEMMNFPGVIGGAPAELRKLALEGADHVDGHAPGCDRQGAAGLCGRRDPLRSRGLDGRRGPRAAPGRDVAADPRGVDGPQPAGAAAARPRARAGADRVLHRRPRSGGHRRQRPRQRDRPRRRCRRSRACGCGADGVVPPGPVARAAAPRGDRPRIHRRPAAASRSRALRSRPRAEARPADRRDPARGRARVGPRHRSDPAGDGAGVRDPLDGRRRPGDRARSRIRS